MADKYDCAQDEIPQGGYPANPNASGKAVPSGSYNVHTSGRFDDYVTGEGQITSTDNDGYAYPGSVLLGKVKT